VGRKCNTHGGEEGCIYDFEMIARRPLEGPRSRWEDNIKMNLR
jgi:hypothetical protein